jgi:hypothetical protein
MSVDFDELNRLHAATTQGGWNNGRYPESTYVWDNVIGNSPIAECDFTDHSINESLANAAWIAAAHNAWPEIAEELQRLREENARLKAEKARGE